MNEIKLHTIKTLMLEDFIEAICNDKLNVLIIAGEPSQEQLQAAFAEIKTDYTSIIGTIEENSLFDLSREIGMLQSEIFYIEGTCGNGSEEHPVIGLLRIKHIPEMIDELRRMGFDGVFNPNDRERYDNELDRILSLSKTKIFDLECLVSQYNNIEKTSTAKKQTRDEFIKTVHYVAKFQGHLIDRKATSTEDFAFMFSNYIAELNFRKKEVSNV